MDRGVEEERKMKVARGVSRVGCGREEERREGGARERVRE